MTQRIVVSEQDFRALAAEHTFREIATIIGCGTTQISRLAARFGVTSKFVNRPASPEERDRAVELVTVEGFTVMEAARALKRSHDFIRKCLAADPLGRTMIGDWPVPDASAAARLSGKLFEDVDGATLRRELGAQRAPINGDALAVAMRSMTQGLP